MMAPYVQIRQGFYLFLVGLGLTLSLDNPTLHFRIIGLGESL